MTNTVFLILSNVVACTTVEWSNDLVTWHPFIYTYVAIPKFYITPDMGGIPRQFWRYQEYGK